MPGSVETPLSAGEVQYGPAPHVDGRKCDVGISLPSPTLLLQRDQKKVNRQGGSPQLLPPRAAASHVTLLFFLAAFLGVSFQMGKQLFSHLGCWEEDASPGCSWPGGAGTKCRGCTECRNGLHMGVKHRAVIYLTGCTSTSPLFYFLTASMTWNVSCDTRSVLGKSLRLWVIYTWSLCCFWS